MSLELCVPSARYFRQGRTPPGRFQKASPRLDPRLLTATQAAAYLGLPVGVFNALGFSSLVIAGRERYDRHLLNAWIDGVSGVTPYDESPEAALRRFLSLNPDLEGESGNTAVENSAMLPAKTKP